MQVQMNRVIEALELEKQEFLNRIAELESREAMGTLQVRPPVRNTVTASEAFELDVLRDHYDLAIFDDIIQLVRDGKFCTIEKLTHYLRTEVENAIPDNDRHCDGDICVNKLPQKNFTRIVTCNEILYIVNHLMPT